MRCGSANFTLLSMPVEEYPTLPQISAQSGLLPAESFATAVAQVAVAASRDDVTPRDHRCAARGVGEQSDTRRDRPVSGGGARGRVGFLRLRHRHRHSPRARAKRSRRSARTFGHSGTISVAITSTDDRELIAFSADRKTVTSLLIKGNFPPVKRLFPETVDNYAVINTAELIEAVSSCLPRPRARGGAPFSRSRSKASTLEAIGSETGTSLRDDRRSSQRRGHGGLAQAGVPPRRSGSGPLGVRAHLVHEDREPEQAGAPC